MRLLRGIRAKIATGTTINAPAFTPTNDSEQAWIAANLDVAQILAAEYAPFDQGKSLYPDVLDRIYAGWWNSPNRSGIDPNYVINAIGLAFGQFLVDHRGMAWTVATDANGSEIAVVGQPGDLLTYPTNLVAKRFERGETHFLTAIDRALVNVHEVVSNT